MTADPRLHFRTPLRQTPFHPRTAAANGLNHWGAWAGYTTALTFRDAAMEYTAIRNAASVYDLCPMVKYRIDRPRGRRLPEPPDRPQRRETDARRRALHRLVRRRGQAARRRHPVPPLGHRDFLLCCQERHLPWLLDSAFGFDVTIREETEDIAALSLQGP